MSTPHYQDAHVTLHHGATIDEAFPTTTGEAD